MATDPALIMRSLSVVSRRAGPASGASCRSWWDLLPAFPPVNPTAAVIIFAVIAASGFWVSGVAVLAVLAVGAGRVALHQIALRGERGGGPRWNSHGRCEQRGVM